MITANIKMKVEKKDIEMRKTLIDFNFQNFLCVSTFLQLSWTIKSM